MSFSLSVSLRYTVGRTARLPSVCERGTRDPEHVSGVCHESRPLRAAGMVLGTNRYVVETRLALCDSRLHSHPVRASSVAVPDCCFSRTKRQADFRSVRGTVLTAVLDEVLRNDGEADSCRHCVGQYCVYVHFVAVPLTPH